MIISCLTIYLICIYALIDIEAIALRKGRSYPLPGKKAGIHNCTRKIAVLLRNGNSLVQEFTPCIRFRQLSGIERKTFLWCQSNVHHLQYYPSRNSNSCANARIYKCPRKVYEVAIAGPRQNIEAIREELL